jgi:hypothetical protein
MIKKLGRATALALLIWVLIFTAISIIMFIPGVGQNTKYFMLIIDPLIVLLCGYLYFSKVGGKALDGLVIGIYWIVFGTILDMIITIPLFVKSYSVFYGEWSLWVSFTLSLVAAVLSAVIFKKKI